jgi:serine/threonine-protein kinase
MSTLLNPGDRCGGHEIIRHLATGGTAEVYLARAPGGDLRAFKIMPAPGAAKKQARFAQEAEILAMIVHPNVLRVHDVGSEGDRVWLSLDLFDAETLRQKLRAGRLPLDHLLHLIHQVCAGLAEAHRMGIVHRDLTPDNILVGPAGTVRVFDFGTAKLEAFGVVTTAEQQTGATRYLPPEVATGKGSGPWTDIYSLGIILYEGIAGEHPMGPEPRTVMDIVRWHVWEQARPLRLLAPGVSLELAALAHQMIEKSPADRPSSVQVLDRLREEQAYLRAPTLRAARNAASVERPFELAPTIPMSTMQDPTTPTSAGPEHDRAALLPAAGPTPAPSPTPRPQAPEARRPAESAPGPAASIDARSTDVPVESAARWSRLTSWAAPAWLNVLCVLSLTGAALTTAWLFLGPDPAAPRPAAPAPAPSASAPTVSASASASASTAAPPASASARSRPPAPRTPPKSPPPTRPTKP